MRRDTRPIVPRTASESSAKRSSTSRRRLEYDAGGKARTASARIVSRASREKPSKSTHPVAPTRADAIRKVLPSTTYCSADRWPLSARAASFFNSGDGASAITLPPTPLQPSAAAARGVINSAWPAASVANQMSPGGCQVSNASAT